MGRAGLVQFPARSDELAGFRKKIREWISAISWLSDQEVNDILVSANEACTNAIEHAYGPGVEGQVTVHISHEPPSTIVISIRDMGTWVEPKTDTGSRGRGLMLMRAMMDSVEILPSAAGTCITMRKTRKTKAAPGGVTFGGASHA